MFKLKTITQDWFNSKQAEPIRKDVPKMHITYESIVDAIKQVEANELMGAGNFSKRDHLADKLFAMFKIGQKNTKPFTVKPLLSTEASQTEPAQKRNLVALTYDRVRETITMVENNDLMGAGNFTKQEHLAETLFALFKLASSTEANAVTAPAQLGAKNAALTGTRAPVRQPAQQPAQSVQPDIDAASFA